MVKSWLVSLFKLFLRNKRYVLLGFVAVAALILFTSQIKAFFIISLLGVAATFSTFYKRVFQAPPAFELITLTVVAVSIFYGPGVGTLYAIVISITSEIAAQALDPFSITYIPPRIATAFVAPWLYGNGTGPVHNIAMLGMLMSILYNALQQPVYYYLTDIEKRIKGLYFSAMNIPLNLLIFKFLGEPLFEILKSII
ncbi:hypothetical protein HYY73_01835 [Candidatus Woesearchaeota archaeon]|nr:hypothetical protein [Candidatus Woesearchaeota archaeon]